VLNPGDSLEEGVTVNVKPAANQSAAPGVQAPAQGSGNGAGGGSGSAGSGAAQPKRDASGGEKK
jgi:hypothetical protein